MHPEILQQQEKLQHLFQQAEQLQQIDDIDDETKSGFVSYLCVRTSGYIESSVKTILREYVKSKTNNVPIVSFVDKQLGYTLTPRREQILDLVGQFNLKWRENLKDSTKGRLDDSLDSIVSNRNKVAHGANAVIHLSNLKEHFEDAQKVVELVYNECDPP